MNVRINKIVKQEGLIIGESIKTMKDLALPINSFLGVGLCNEKKRELTQGVPLDLLGMIFVVEKLEQVTSVEQKNILIADIHAKGNEFSNEEVDKVAHQYKETLETTIENLGFEGWKIRFGSEIIQQERYQQLLQTIPIQKDYVKREVADIEWFRKQGMNLKIGWWLKGGENSEKMFDDIYIQTFGEKMSFLYLIPGMTMDPKRPRMAPYFCPNRDARILLEKEENVLQKMTYAKEEFGEPGLKAYKNYLKKVARLYNQIGELEKGPIEQQLQEIIVRCTE